MKNDCALNYQSNDRKSR